MYDDLWFSFSCHTCARSFREMSRLGRQRRWASVGTTDWFRQELMTDETWGTVLETLRDQLGANTFSNWIEPLSFSDVTDGVATFHVPTNFMGNYVAQNYSEQIVYLMNRSGAEVSRAKFAVAQKSAAQRPNLRLPNNRLRILPLSPVRRLMHVSPSTPLLSASQTSLPMPPRSVLPKAGRLRLTRCFFMVALAWARPTSCTRSHMNCRRRSRSERSLSLCRTIHVPL